jgi:hypothetical protein
MDEDISLRPPDPSMDFFTMSMADFEDNRDYFHVLRHHVKFANAILTSFLAPKTYRVMRSPSQIPLMVERRPAGAPGIAMLPAGSMSVLVHIGPIYVKNGGKTVFDAAFPLECVVRLLCIGLIGPVNHYYKQLMGHKFPCTNLRVPPGSLLGIFVEDVRAALGGGVDRALEVLDVILSPMLVRRYAKVILEERKNRFPYLRF